MTSSLQVLLGDVPCGTLAPTNEGSTFELDHGYLTLPDRPVLGQTFEDDPRRRWTRQGVPAWFANLLPEGPLLRLIAVRAGVHETRSLFLLSVIGEDLPGAVVVRGTLEGEEVAPSDQADGPSDGETLRFSLAGVQLKLSAVRDGRGLTIPAHGQGGDWIVKLPDHHLAHVPERTSRRSSAPNRRRSTRPQTTTPCCGSSRRSAERMPATRFCVVSSSCSQAATPTFISRIGR